MLLNLLQTRGFFLVDVAAYAKSRLSIGSNPVGNIMHNSHSSSIKIFVKGPIRAQDVSRKPRYEILQMNLQTKRQGPPRKDRDDGITLKGLAKDLKWSPVKDTLEGHPEGGGQWGSHAHSKCHLAKACCWAANRGHRWS